ncbi:MAG TPA: hypothetical protein VM031_02060 [Phycisphaerae bacterium]|nr:hypothetical protein [Phycisphaerae bacterium]
MKTFWILLVLCGMFFLMGCTSAETTEEHGRRLWLTTDLQARNLVEDWDNFWLYDRNCRMSRWYTRMGY